MRLFPAALLLSLAPLGACVGPWYAYDFAPAPQEARVVDEGVADSQARTLASLLGIRRPEKGQPARVLAKLLVENVGATAVRLVPGSIELATSDLTTFAASAVEPAEALELQPGEKRTFEIAFALPAGREPADYGFEGLALKFGLDFGRGAPVETSLSFQRTVAIRDEPRVHTSFGFGYGWR